MWWPLGKKYPECHPAQVDSKTYDFVVVEFPNSLWVSQLTSVVVSGGTAGCTLASRLSENPKISVLVLECGPANDTWLSRNPLISSDPTRPTFGATRWKSEPMKYCDNRRSGVFRGEVLGGTSRINSMIYTRGTAADYDAWASLGHSEWSYEKLLPYFVKSETSLDYQDSTYHGNTGPWITQTFTYFNWLFQAYRAFTDCAKSMGFIAIPDCNAPGAPPEGVATHSLTLSKRRERVSSLEAFLPKKIALERRNLTICTNTLVSRIVFTQEKGLSHRKFENTYSVKVNKEDIVCSSAIGSPQVLMLNGTGPRESLEEHGIKVVHDLPGVGSTLTDHYSIPVAWEVPAAESLLSIATSPLKIALELFKYIFFQVGLFSIPVQTLAPYVRSGMIREDSTGLVEKLRRNLLILKVTSPTLSSCHFPRVEWIISTNRNSKTCSLKPPYSAF
ncbi:hypothetical protein BCON_0230g00130 [Botryotinia convoluta]|uniref:Glucose-methanol-choline oxidoreductase N-terminal domain-containing protein n=1 Tax=Botryotinia convoluta TaxID=54673 RepID=A0A4Z1HQ00_9HELO|nr:hypothetical protein BCON_0230g00130 [Botryotinia convoluta]